MSSTNQDRSLGSGISIPNWMKGKTDNHHFDPSTLSPPTHEDDFFYIRFPRPVAQAVDSNSNFKSLSEAINAHKEDALSKHTTSCKLFIPSIKETVETKKPKIIKPMGVDDGFKGPGAACGASVIAVAEQMLAGTPKSPVRGFTTDDAQKQMPSKTYMRQRRNSKSLPASPLGTPETSPRSRRKNNTAFALQNRFFTAGLLGVDKSLNESDENLEKKSGSSWLLAGLLSRESSSPPQQEQALVEADGSIQQHIKQSRDNSETDRPVLETLNLSVQVKQAPASPTPERSFFRPKPSELREMNFWSPTSM